MPVMHTAIPCTGSTADQAVNTVLLVGGKARHAQGQRLDRYKVRRKEKVRERKGRGKCPPSFLCF